MPKVAAATNNLPKTVNPVPTMEKNTSFTQWLLLLSLLVPFIQSEVVESTVKECKVDECIKQDSCPYFPTVLDDLEEELNRDTEKYKEMVDVVKESVCNREEKGVCCEDFNDEIAVRSILPRGRSCCQ